MTNFSNWQNSIISVKISGRKGEQLTFTMKRIVYDYACCLLGGHTEDEALKELGATEADAVEWRRTDAFKDFMAVKNDIREFTSGIDKDFVYNLLGRAALGEIELTAQQIAALNLIMKGKGIIGVYGGSKRDGAKNTKFELEDQD